MTHLQIERTRSTFRAVSDVCLRAYRDTTDVTGIHAVFERGNEECGLERVVTEDDLQSWWDFSNVDRTNDIVVAETDDRVVGFGFVTTAVNAEGVRFYTNDGDVLPAWRRQGIGSMLLRWNERRIAALANDQEVCPASFVEGYAYDTEYEREQVLWNAGYRAVRRMFTLRRSLTDIPSLPLPSGIEIRAVRPEHSMAILAAANEAFRDHWQAVDMTPQQFDMLLGLRDCDPELWIVAWDGAEIAGMVHGRIDPLVNARFDRSRGRITNVCVRRPWRGRGLARALMATSMETLRARGMSEVELGVDAQSLTGALRLYEGLGFRTAKYWTVFHKSLAAIRDERSNRMHG